MRLRSLDEKRILCIWWRLEGNDAGVGYDRALYPGIERRRGAIKTLLGFESEETFHKCPHTPHPHTHTANPALYDSIYNLQQ
jgi:hypothetical protein